MSGALLGSAGCVVEDDDTAERATTPAASRTDARTTASSDSALDVSTPLAGYRDVDRERLARERYDDAWRQSASREYEARRQARSQQPESQARPVPTSPKVPIHGLKSAHRQGDDGRSAPSGSSPSDGSAEGSETYEEITAESLRGEPVLPIPSDGAGPTVLRVQWMLDRARFSPGIIDGRWGKNTEKAVYWLQEELGMEPTGQVDRALWDLLAQQVGTAGATRQYQVTQDDVDGPFVTIPEEYADQADLDCLCYESAEELISEKFHVDPELLAQLNPDVDLGNLTAGQSLWVPNVEVMEENMETPDEVDRIVVSKGGFYLHALDENGDIIYHFPSTLGSEYDPSPSGKLEINTHAYEPKFHYQPKLFPEVPDTEEDQMLPGGPNSPVGMVWLDLSKPHYGIHGTAEPATIGYTTSHGCVRLTNWDALFLANRVPDGAAVEFRE